MTGSARIFGLAAILASTCFEAIGQVAFKSAADPTEEKLPFFRNLVANAGSIALGIGSFVFEAALWSAALYFLDVSVAQPIGSIAFVEVAIASRLFLKEKISPIRWAGIACILGGSVLVAMS